MQIVSEDRELCRSQRIQPIESSVYVVYPDSVLRKVLIINQVLLRWLKKASGCRVTCSCHLVRPCTMLTRVVLLTLVAEAVSQRGAGFPWTPERDEEWRTGDAEEKA